MDLNNNQMLLLAVAVVALYFFMKYRQCSKQENFSSQPINLRQLCIDRKTKKFCKNNTPKCIEAETQFCNKKIAYEWGVFCDAMIINIKKNLMNGKGVPSDSCDALNKLTNAGYCKNYINDMNKYCKIKK